ncbi:hypothetical protein GP486_008428, partial [Trichoglossum hirsutum]
HPDIRRNFRRWSSSGRRASQTEGSYTAMPTTAGGPNGDIDERAPLLARPRRRPSYLDEHRPWIRYLLYTYHVTKVTLLSNWVNVLLICVPLGIIAGAIGFNASAVFTLNFLAIIPLAAILSFATEELSAKLGQTIGGLLNATFGNAVELIVSIVALTRGEIRIVQSSMLGSILSNILLVRVSLEHRFPMDD